MLLEFNVSPYSPWEVEEKRIRNDSRFSILPSEKERINAFNSYCKGRAKEIQEESKAKSNSIREVYNDFLKENATAKSLWPEFIRKVKRQFTGKMDIRECEKIFKSYIKDLKSGSSKCKYYPLIVQALIFCIVV